MYSETRIMNGLEFFLVQLAMLPQTAACVTLERQSPAWGVGQARSMTTARAEYPLSLCNSASKRSLAW